MTTSTAPPSEPAAVILAGDLLKWIIPKVGKFPRSVRYGLGSRIEAAHLDVLEELIHAQYTRGADRARSLDYANRRLQVARHLIRMANEMKLISDKSAVYVAALQVDLGNQVGSVWICLDHWAKVACELNGWEADGDEPNALIRTIVGGLNFLNDSLSPCSTHCGRIICFDAITR